MAETDIAVVGMACRLPGAPDLEAFWQLLRDGRDARRELSDEHLRAAGVPEELLANPDFVKAAMVLDDIDRFDAGFFGFSPRDAALFDPQHRVWLEVCWEAFEHAGHVPERFDGRVGVFAGCGMDTYLLHNVLTNPDLVRQIGMFLIRHTGNDKDFLATRTSYQFDLRGPSVNVVTACSTSLVAVHQAAQSLLNGECDMALAGGVTILVPQDRGYLFKEGEVLSSDGHCRAFDADSDGTIFGSGAGCVVLRRLQDALDDGDTIHAVIAGSAVNNDGARKVSYLAPSVDGYAEVVAEALALADVAADDVQYVEAHGTGTKVGDPIEVEALTQAFRASTGKSGFCGIGSVKTNIGHLDTAAGIAGMLKVVLAMQHGELPASLNYRRPNPLIDFEHSPFRVVADKQDWPRPAGGARTAGVSSLGVGGTNAHVIVREPVDAAAAAVVEPAKPYPRRCHLLPISGKAKEAAVGNARRMAEWLSANPDADLADVSWTLQHGRRGFSFRGFAVGADGAELAASLTADDWAAQLKKAPERAPSVVFLFPGGGAQYPGMAKELYEFEPAFREAADRCLAALPDPHRQRVFDLLFGAATTPDRADEMERPSLLLPTLFVVEYGLAETLRSFGVEPDAMLGHSLGEYVAATLCGTWTLDQVMPVLVLRGECMEQSETGAVLSVSLPAADVQALGDVELSLSAANAPKLSAVAGSPDAIARLERTLQERDVDHQRLRIGVGAHSHLLDPVLDRFREGLRRFTPRVPERRWVSNVTGTWVDPQRAADPDYWVEHLRRTVRFEDGVATLLDGGDRLFIEVGPGKALTSLVRMHERARSSQALVTVPHPKDNQPADAFLLGAVGRMWQHGVAFEWQRLHGGVARRRVPLPTYAWQRQRYWIEPGAHIAQEGVVASGEPTPPTRLPESQWLQCAVWKARELPDTVRASQTADWLVVGAGAFARRFTEIERAAGRTVVTVSADLDDVDALERATAEFARCEGPRRVLFAAALDDDDAARLTWRMIALLQALARNDAVDGTHFAALTSHAVSVNGEPLRHPGPAALAGLLRVVPREFQEVRAVVVDADEAALDRPEVLAAALCREVESTSSGLGVAIRGGRRHVQELAPVDVEELPPPTWPRASTWWISGGLGGIGLRLAEHLARTCAARLLLLSRRGLPPRALWDDWVALRAGDRVAQLIGRVRALEELGAEVEVVAADVADRESMARCVQVATTRFGPPFGIVHAAGVLDDGPLLMRSRERTEAMMRPKIGGAVVLDECTADLEPQNFVVFASTSGLAGIPGQCDYAAANAALDAFAQWRSAARPGRTVAIDWGIWQDAGMLAGAEQLSLPAPSWLGERSERGDLVEFAAMWSPTTHWMIAEHRVRDGDCVMPGTGHIELMVAAVQAVAGAAQVTLEGVEFRTPLAFRDDAPRAVVVQVRKRPNGYQVVVASAASEQHAEHERVTHAQAVARVGAVGDAVLDVAAARAEAQAEADASSDQARHVAFGPRWQCIERVGVGDGLAFADLQLPEAFAADLAEHRSHAALLDMAFGCGIRLLSKGHDDALFVPVGCERVVIHGRMPARLVSSVRLREHDPHARLGTFDVTLATPAGVVVAELLGLSLYGVRGTFGGEAGNSAPAPAPAVAAPPAPKPAAPRIAAILARGITAPEGMVGFERALAAGLPRVVVSSLDVARTADWLSLPPEQPRAVRIDAGDERGDAEVEGPRDDTERALAAAFSELLGVDTPSIDDDFFEIGGHSLLAVRLFARVHKEFGLDLELATLLSAGTVRKLAAVVREELSLPDPGDAPARSVSAHKGQHVVPIQTGGTRPNLFLVHGAGGNVLGFRDLAHYFGKDQPVYGLQARGVDGKQPPHATIAEMARAYLAEVREVQPHGPYYLGGYSGGGVIAYEMAQLLCAVGEPVAFVGMIDSWCPQMPRRGRLARALLHVGRMLKKGPMYPIEILRIKMQRRSAARDTERARQQGGTLPQDKRGFEVQFAFENAFANHVVEPYPGDVWLFKAEDQQHGTRYIVDDKLGWQPFVQGELHVEACPGNHFTMCTEPNVQVLCERMMAGMDRAIAKVDR